MSFTKHRPTKADATVISCRNDKVQIVRMKAAVRVLWKELSLHCPVLKAIGTIHKILYAWKTQYVAPQVEQWRVKENWKHRVVIEPRRLRWLRSLGIIAQALSSSLSVFK